MTDARLVAAAIAAVLGTATGLALPSPRPAQGPPIPQVAVAPDLSARPVDTCVCPHSDARQRLAALHTALRLISIKAAPSAISAT